MYVQFCRRMFKTFLLFLNLLQSPAENLVLYGVFTLIVGYQFFDIFMVIYFGNEIKFWSGRLLYSLFESNWMDQSQLCKKCFIIFAEVLKRPQVLVVGKLYPLDLEIFSNVRFSINNNCMKMTFVFILDLEWCLQHAQYIKKFKVKL